MVLPELWTTGAFAYESFDAEAESLEGPTSDAMANAASEAGVWLHAGSIPERAPDGTLYNTSLVFTPGVNSPPRTARSTASVSTRARPC
ncbi:hypothetical protein SAV31267_048880 [Streptomyces avermitilis]|uniref:CN hydrolase domain-containing protein n=1 Tax=Streptomyces avermitilis TaxID=33903 RepID=A0A4D4MTD9_STRAX|nr:hypothetical protein SAV31267_048880 [Streptomyces avermitilis]